MTTDFESLPPADRARKRFATLLAKSDEGGNVCAYDVWPYAEAFGRLLAMSPADYAGKARLPEMTQLRAAHHPESTVDRKQHAGVGGGGIQFFVE